MTKLNFSEKYLVSYDPSEIIICWSDSRIFFLLSFLCWKLFNIFVETDILQDSLMTTL